MRRHDRMRYALGGTGYLDDVSYTNEFVAMKETSACPMVSSLLSMHTQLRAVQRILHR